MDCTDRPLGGGVRLAARPTKPGLSRRQLGAAGRATGLGTMVSVALVYAPEPGDEEHRLLQQHTLDRQGGRRRDFGSWRLIRECRGASVWRRANPTGIDRARSHRSVAGRAGDVLLVAHRRFVPVCA